MKYYFETKESETCYDLESIKDMMRADGITERTVFEAIKDNVGGYFWCKAIGEVGEKGQCGKQCSDYEPRNGKSGCCKYFGSLYTATDKTLTVNIGEE